MLIFLKKCVEKSYGRCVFVTMFSIINTYYRQACRVNTKRKTPCGALRLSLPSFTLFYNNSDLLAIHSVRRVCVCVCMPGTTTNGNICERLRTKIKDKLQQRALWNTIELWGKLSSTSLSGYLKLREVRLANINDIWVKS